MRQGLKVVATLVSVVTLMLFGVGATWASSGSNAESAQRVLRGQGVSMELAMKATRAPGVDFTVRGREVSIAPGAAPAAARQALASSVIVPAAKGSDWWYGVVVNGVGQLRTVVYIRYSWSWMWYLKLHNGTYAALSTSACGFLPRPVGPACAALVTGYYLYVNRKVDQGILLKKCLQIRIGAPPLVDYSLTRFDLVTCRI